MCECEWGECGMQVLWAIYIVVDKFRELCWQWRRCFELTINCWTKSLGNIPTMIFEPNVGFFTEIRVKLTNYANMRVTRFTFSAKVQANNEHFKGICYTFVVIKINRSFKRIKNSNCSIQYIKRLKANSTIEYNKTYGLKNIRNNDVSI